MYNNPYAQGWPAGGSHAGHGPSSPSPWGYGGDSAPPSVFGALPYPAPTAFPAHPSDLTTLYFTSFNPTILNCTVFGLRSQPCYSVTTDESMPGYTVWKDRDGRNIALAEWQRHPSVEVRGLVSKQPVPVWLRLSRDRSYRIMEVRGYSYVWAPSGPSICLYTKSQPQQMLGKITKAQAHITLEMTSHAVQLGLMESCVVATVLLQCGRNID